MRLSIIVSILDSHEVVRRQILHYHKMNVPGDAEIIFMDDGSDPPLNGGYGLSNLTICPTNDNRPWSWPAARNKGAALASGEYLLMMDIDYILTTEALNSAIEFSGDRMFFQRQFGILDEAGRLVTDKETLLSYGLKEKHLASTNFFKGHRNNFVIKKSLFEEMSGYNEELIDRPYSQIDGPDSSFKRIWNRFLRAGKAVEYKGYKPTLYMFPNGRFCEKNSGLFHNLKRK